MKNLAKGFATLLICGAFVFANCDTAEAAQVADLNSGTLQTQDLARHPHHPPPPPPPPHWDRHPHYPPPPPPPHHHPPHFDGHPHHPSPPPPHRHRW